MERCFSRLFFAINCAVISGSVFASQVDQSVNVHESWLSTGTYSLENPKLPEWELNHRKAVLEKAIKAGIQTNTTITLPQVFAPDSNAVNALIAEGTQIKAGGGGGNEKLGLTCYSPSVYSMDLCRNYVSLVDNVTYANNGSEVLFGDTSDNAIFAEFDGYPFIVTQVGDTCYLENDYVTTIKYDINSNNDTAYGYDCSSRVEHFGQEEVDAIYYDFFSFSPENDAHFYGGVVMQMYHSYLDDLFPDQKIFNPSSPDCPTNNRGEPNGDYCLKRLSQRSHALGITGGHLDNANWDGEYVNYGNGQWAQRFYTLTTIDLVAHESMHALSEWNGNLDYTGQTGAIGEGLGDISAIAANHYFENHLLGNQEDNYKNSTGYQNKRIHEWSYAWDSYVNNEFLRMFEVPSFDGYSIDDARDYDANKDKYYNAGVIRKLFYELVMGDDWTHEQAFKLFLSANVSCFTPNITFDEMGSCLLNQVDTVFSSFEADSQKATLDERLHRLGIVASNTQINALSFSQSKQYEQSQYWISSSVDINDIAQVTVDWGDGTQVNWPDNNGTNIEDVLSGQHVYALGKKHVNFSLNVLKKDNTLLQGLSQDYIHDSQLLCTPQLASPNGEVTRFTFMGQEYVMPNTGYKYLDARHLTFPNTEQTPITIEGNFTGKNVSVFADINRDGYFNRDELLTEEKPIVDGSLTLAGLADIDAGPILLRVVLDDYTAWGCSTVYKGMAFDILATLEAAATPPTAEFTYEITGTTNVQFNAVTTEIDDSRNPEFTWSYQQTGQSEVSMGQGETLNYYFPSTGNYSVKLAVTYDDGLQDTSTQSVFLGGGMCIPEKSFSFSDSSVYIDQLEYAADVYSGELPSEGRFSGAYIEHDASDSIKTAENQSITLDVYTETIPEIWANIYVRKASVRTTLWVDFNANGAFDSSEHVVANNQSYTCEGNNSCRVKSTIVMPMSSSVQQGRVYKARVKMEYDFGGDFDEAQGENACDDMKTGEVEDFDLKIM